MAVFREKIETSFENLARLIYHNRLKTLFLMTILVVGLLSQLPKLTQDNSNESFFHKDDPNLVQYNDFREQFGRDETIIVALDPPDVFDRSFLEKLREFHHALEEEVPYLKEITSLSNVRETRGEGDQLIVKDLLKEIPQSPEAMAELKERVLSSDLYPNYIISKDGTVTTIFIETVPFSPEKGGDDLIAGFEEAGENGNGAINEPTPLTEAENSEVVRAVEKVAARFEAPDFPIHLSGSPVLLDFYHTLIQKDVGKFMGLALLAFTVFLLYLFRRPSGALMPMLVVILSLLSTFSLMAIFGAPFTLVTSVLPSFMISVGVGNSVHILAIFYRRFRETGNKEEAIVYTFGHSGLPVFMTSVTTAVGLLCFSTAEMAPVADLGIFGGIGVLMILLFTLVLMPALIAVFPLPQNTLFEGKKTGQTVDRFLTWVANFSSRKPWAIMAISGVLVIGAGVGLSFQEFGHSILNFLPTDSAVRQTALLLDRKMKTGMGFAVVVNVGNENGLYEPQMMNHIEELSTFAESYRDETGNLVVGSTSSIVDVLQETHKALNSNDPEYYAIPQDRKLIAQELLLFENSGSDDLERLVDTRFSKTRINLMTRSTTNGEIKDASDYVDFANDLGREAERIFGNSAKIAVTGTGKLLCQIVDLMMISVAKGYIIAGILISILMMFMMGSYRIGLLSMIPNLVPIIITMGAMGWLGIKLDMSNMLLGTLAIGMAVDDTIHFFHNFRGYYTKSQNAAEATRQTLLSTGRAMLFTTVVLVTGFWLFMFSTLNNLFNFGLLVGLTLIMALLSDFFLAPALMELITRNPHGRNILERWGKTRQRPEPSILTS